MQKEPCARPPSCVGRVDQWVGLAALTAAYLTLARSGKIDDLTLSASLVLSVIISLGVIEISRAPWRSQPPSDEPVSVIIKRAVAKTAICYIGIAGLGFLYWLIPEYRKPYYLPFFNGAGLVLPSVLSFAFPYFLFAEWRFPRPTPDTRQVLGTGSLAITSSGILGLIVRGFFLPIMFCDLVELVGRIRMSHFDWSRVFLQNFYFLVGAFLAAELAFVTAGYLSACRLFNSQIRAVDRTLMAWVAALVCYKPFLGLFFTSYFGYRSELDWTDILPDNSPAMVL
jgi:hypothetical protein